MGFAFHLVGLSFGLGLGVARHATDRVLHRPLRLLESTFNVFFVHYYLSLSAPYNNACRNTVFRWSHVHIVRGPVALPHLPHANSIVVGAAARAEKGSAVCLSTNVVRLVLQPSDPTR